MRVLPPGISAYPSAQRLARLTLVGGMLLLPWIVAPRPSLAATPGQVPRVRLSISVARTSYPREALVQVTVRMRNVSRVPVVVGSAQAVECPKIGPSAVMLSVQWTQVYPPALHGGLIGSCGPYRLDTPGSLRPLLPGRTAIRHQYVILRGPTIQAIATYYVPTADGYVQVHVTSKPISLSLYDAPKPTLTLTTSPALSATITPLAGAHAATLRLVSQWLCPDDRGARGTGPIVNWLPVKPDSAGSYMLEPGCAQPYQWHMAAGFPNEPVVYIDYCRPSDWGCGLEDHMKTCHHVMGRTSSTD